MSTTIHRGLPQSPWIRKLKPKLPNYLIKRKALAIRERIIARKYANIYFRRVFGKYHPSECTRYYERRLLGKGFQKLKYQWCENKLQIRFMLRADSHYEEKVTRRMFDNWRTVTGESKRFEGLMRIARQTYDNNMLSGSFRKWRMFTRDKQRFRLIKYAAIKLYDLMYYSLFLLGFMKYMYDREENVLLESKAKLFSRNNMLRKCVGRWKSYSLEKKVEKILHSRAEKHFIHKMILIYFTNWYKYICFKRTKHEILKGCQELYEDALLKNILRVWNIKRRHKIEEAKNILMVDELYSKSIRRKSFSHWKRYARHKLCGRAMKHKVDFYYQIKLKQRMLNTFSKNVIRRRRENLACQKLKLFYRRILISNVWNEWILMIDDKHDCELTDKLLTAKTFYKGRIVKKYFALWFEYKEFEHRKKDLDLKAMDFCRAFFFKKYLATWRLVCAEKIQTIILYEKATKFYNDSLIQYSISEWVNAFNVSISLKAKYQKSVSHYRENIVSKCWFAWVNFCNTKIQTQNLIEEARQYYLEKLLQNYINKLAMNVIRMKAERQKLEIANNLHRNKLLHRIFSIWKKYYHHTIEYSTKLNEFDKNKQVRLQKKIIVHWQLYVIHKKCCNRRILLSANHYRRRLIAAAFKKLQNYTNYREDKYARLGYLTRGVGKIKFEMKKMYFQKWRGIQINVLQEKRRVFQADGFHRIHLARKYFNLWDIFSKEHRIKLQLKENLNNVGKCILLKKCMAVWYVKYQAALNLHFRERWVSSIHEMKIKYKYFRMWKHYIDGKIKQRVEIENAKEFHKKLVVKEGLKRIVKICLHKTESRYENRLKTVTRNSLQDFEILRKYFNKWLRAVPYKYRHKFQETDQLTSNTKLFTGQFSAITPRLLIPEFMKNEMNFLNNTQQLPGDIPLVSNRKEMRRLKTYNNNRQLMELNRPLDYNFGPSKVYNSQETHHTRSLVIGKSNDSEFQTNKKSVQNDGDEFGSPQLEPNRENMIPSEGTSNFKVTNQCPNTQNISPDSLKLNLDSARTYKVQSPLFFNGLRENYSPNYFNNYNSVFTHEGYHDCRKDVTLLPPSVFCIKKKSA